MTETTPETTTETATVMTGTLRSDPSRSFTWLASEPHLIGDTELVARIKTRLFMLSVKGDSIAVTPTGPFVEPVESDREAVFAAGNELTRYGLDWEGAPDVTYGAPADAIF